MPLDSKPFLPPEPTDAPVAPSMQPKIELLRARWR